MADAALVDTRRNPSNSEITALWEQHNLCRKIEKVSDFLRSDNDGMIIELGPKEILFVEGDENQRLSTMCEMIAIAYFAQSSDPNFSHFLLNLEVHSEDEDVSLASPNHFKHPKAITEHFEGLVHGHGSLLDKPGIKLEKVLRDNGFEMQDFKYGSNSPTNDLSFFDEKRFRELADKWAKPVRVWALTI